MSSLTFDKLACLQAPFEAICVSVKNFVRYINITHNVMKNIVIFRLQIQNNVVIRYYDGPLANTLYLIWKKAKDNICVNVYLRKIFRYEFLFPIVNMLNISASSYVVRKQFSLWKVWKCKLSWSCNWNEKVIQKITHELNLTQFLIILKYFNWWINDMAYLQASPCWRL